MNGRAFVLALSLAPLACGAGSGPTSPAARLGSIGGTVIERSATGDQTLAGRTLVAWLEQQRQERRVVTDSQGRYELSTVPEGTRVWLNITGSSTGIPWSHCALVVVAVEGPINFDVVVTHDFIPGMSVPDPPGYRSISGVVYEITPSGRRPMVGVSVNFGLTWVEGNSSGTRFLHWTRTDGEGRFRLCGLPETSGGLVIASDDDTREVRVPVTQGPSTSLEIELP